MEFYCHKLGASKTLSSIRPDNSNEADQLALVIKMMGYRMYQQQLGADPYFEFKFHYYDYDHHHSKIVEIMGRIKALEDKTYPGAAQLLDPQFFSAPVSSEKNDRAADAIKNILADPDKQELLVSLAPCHQDDILRLSTDAYSPEVCKLIKKLGSKLERNLSSEEQRLIVENQNVRIAVQAGINYLDSGEDFGFFHRRGSTGIKATMQMFTKVLSGKDVFHSLQVWPTRSLFMAGSNRDRYSRTYYSQTAIEEINATPSVVTPLRDAMAAGPAPTAPAKEPSMQDPL